MRKLMTLTLASSALVAIACGKDKTPTSAMSADLKRDLQMASATQNIAINPDEVTPSSKPAVALRPRKAPEGPKVIRTQHPTVKASAAPVEVAEIKTDVPQVEVMASAPAPAQTPVADAPPMARPAAIPAQQYPSGGSTPGPYDGRGPGSGTGGIGGIFGGIFGGVMRGGIGDDDHCEPRPRGGSGRPVGGGSIYGGGMGRAPSGNVPRAPMLPGRPRY